jgi:hypothetical protein
MGGDRSQGAAPSGTVTAGGSAPEALTSTIPEGLLLLLMLARVPRRAARIVPRRGSAANDKCMNKKCSNASFKLEIVKSFTREAHAVQGVQEHSKNPDYCHTHSAQSVDTAREGDCNCRCEGR